MYIIHTCIVSFSLDTFIPMSLLLVLLKRRYLPMIEYMMSILYDAQVTVLVNVKSHDDFSASILGQI